MGHFLVRAYHRRVTDLSEVVANLGVGVLDVVAAPAGVDVSVEHIEIFDSAHPAARAGALVLGVGVDPTARAAVDVIATLADAGATGIVVKGEAASLVTAARDAGVALLATAPEMDWGQLHALLRTALTAAGQAPRETGGVALGDLFALANAVAAMVGGPTTIEDARSTVLAYSSLDEPIDDARRETILGRRISDEWMERLTRDGVFRRLYSSPIPIVIDYHDEIPGFASRLAIAVRAGEEVLGSIWVADAGKGFDDHAHQAIRDAADIAALHLLRTDAAVDLARRHRSELLRAALDGRAAPEALAAAVGLPTGKPVTVVVFQLTEEPSPAATAMRAERLVSLIGLHCEAYRRASAAVAIGNVVHVLLPETDSVDRARLAAFVRDLVARTSEAARTELRAALGSTVDSIDQLATSNREATRVLHAMVDAAAPAGSVATLDEMRSRVFMSELRELTGRQPELRAGKVDVLIDHDREKQTDYVETLRAYLDHFGDVPSAAASLNVHPNTFRYRFRRLLDVSGLDLDDSVERVVAHLQLMLVNPPNS
jgi:DNA-binding PucR family transcriptional regulator